MVNFLHRFSRRTSKRASRPFWNDWDPVKEIDRRQRVFDKRAVHDQNKLQNHALTVVKGQIDVEGSKKKISGSHVGAIVLVVKLYQPFINDCHAFIRHLYLPLVSYNTWKSDLAVGLAGFDYAVLFSLSELQSSKCYKQLLKLLAIEDGWIKTCGLVLRTPSVS